MNCKLKVFLFKEVLVEMSFLNSFNEFLKQFFLAVNNFIEVMFI